MLNICLDLQDLNSKTCEIHVETGHRRRKTVQFPYLILLFVFISLIVYAGFYYYHLAKISITYSVKDFILDRNRFFSELYFYRIRKILSSSTVSGNRNESDVILRNRQRTSMRLCSGTTYLRSKTKSSGEIYICLILFYYIRDLGTCICKEKKITLSTPMSVDNCKGTVV